MRHVWVLAVAVAVFAGGEAQARREFSPKAEKSGPRIDRVDIIEKGVFRAIAQIAHVNSDSPTGNVRQLASVELTHSDDKIKIAQGMLFGIRYTIRGFPAGARVPIRVVQRYPIAGLTNPRTGKTSYSYQHTSMKVVGYPAFEGYNLGAGWELVPGIWSFEIWHNGRLLAEQKFELTAN